ncbi:hypothetical protein F5B20DRAFT_34034 [Whalleya microplaca]|nr:hypothetical protein F5B20DRAFT_34034 [Whalleya microplaca]
MDGMETNAGTLRASPGGFLGQGLGTAMKKESSRFFYDCSCVSQIQTQKFQLGVFGPGVWWETASFFLFIFFSFQLLPSLGDDQSCMCLSASLYYASFLLTIHLCTYTTWLDCFACSQLFSGLPDGHTCIVHIDVGMNKECEN